MKRRRKTPETDIAAEIRKYANGYAATGQKEHADGMLQAADMVDGFMAKARTNAHSGAKVHSIDLSPSNSLEARVAELEKIVSVKYPLLLEATVKERPERRPKPNGAPVPVGDPSLSAGEYRILAAIVQRGGLAATAQRGGVTLDELTAIVNLRATSLRTYLGNLRAAGYSMVSGGRHYPTDEGVSRVGGSPTIPYGSKLLEWWLDGHLSPGEERILRAVASSGSVSVHAVRDLIGETTGLRATSVRTYLNNLSRRKLIRRGYGGVTLAPWLTDAS